jgi:hypothetical protein
MYDYQLRALIRQVKTAGATFVVLLTMATGVWYWARSHYQAQLESYRRQVEVMELSFAEVGSAFDNAIKLAGELREPQIWRIDTVFFDSSGKAQESTGNPIYLYVWWASGVLV